MNAQITLRQEAAWENEDRHRPAIIECTAIRFFSLTPRDKQDAERINIAAKIAALLVEPE